MTTHIKKRGPGDSSAVTILSTVMDNVEVSKTRIYINAFPKIQDVRTEYSISGIFS